MKEPGEGLAAPNQGRGAGGSLWLTVAPGWDQVLGLKPFSTSVSPESKWRKLSPRELYLLYSASEPGSSYILGMCCRSGLTKQNKTMPVNIT